MEVTEVDATLGSGGHRYRGATVGLCAAMNGQSTAAPKLPTIYASGTVSCYFSSVTVQEQPPAFGEVKKLWKQVFA